MKVSASRSLLILELLGLLLFDIGACGMMRWIGDAPVTLMRLLVVALFLLLLGSSLATLVRAVDYFRADAWFDAEPRSTTRLLSLAVPVALVVVVASAMLNPAERVDQLTTSTTLLFFAAAAPAVHLEIVAWLRQRADDRLR